MGMGLIKDTDDIIKFGGVLGAMGALILMMIYQLAQPHTWLPVIIAMLGV